MTKTQTCETVHVDNLCGCFVGQTHSCGPGRCRNCDETKAMVVAVRTAAIEHNVAVITTPPFGDDMLTKLVDVAEAERRVRAGESLKGLMP